MIITDDYAPCWLHAFSKARFYPMFSRFSFVVAGEVRLPSSQNKDHQIPDDHMGVLRHDSSIPTRFHWSSLEPYLNYSTTTTIASVFKESITQSQIEIFHLSRPLTSA